MIECKYKWQMIATNRGITTWFCEKFQKFVNDSICSECEAREGSMLRPLQVMDFPEKTQEELAVIQNVCSGCPLFQKHDQRCAKLTHEPQPTDIWGIHPNNHCPEDKW